MTDGHLPHPDHPMPEDHPGGRDDASQQAEAGRTEEENLAQVTVTVDEDHLSSLDQVVDELRSHGMHVDAVLETLGMVTGSTTDVERLRDVDGVSGVDAQLEHRIPPPEEDIQ